MLPDKLPSLRQKLLAKAEAEAQKEVSEVLEGKENGLVKVKKLKVLKVGKAKLNKQLK